MDKVKYLVERVPARKGAKCQATQVLFVEVLSVNRLVEEWLVR